MSQVAEKQTETKPRKIEGALIKKKILIFELR